MNSECPISGFFIFSPHTQIVNNDDDDDGDDADDEDDLDYNGSNSSGSDSIVIKIASKDGNSSKLADNPDTNRLPPTERPNVDSIVTTSTATISTLAPADANIGVANASPSTATSNYNYNNENYYSKDDMSVYDDVNNNRLNLRSSNTNGRLNAYEERNIYVANNVLSDNANDSVKSYIHIEVYKGNLDNGAVTSKPKEAKSINGFAATASATKSMTKSDGTAEISTTKP